MLVIRTPSKPTKKSTASCPFIEPISYRHVRFILLILYLPLLTPFTTPIAFASLALLPLHLGRLSFFLFLFLILLRWPAPLLLFG